MVTNQRGRAGALRRADASMRERLQMLLQEHNQAEIARCTGVRQQNVHRYLTDSRVPAAFCGALILNLGVDAHWLMTGEGAVATPEQPQAATASPAVAMHAATLLRVGELLGPNGFRALRELDHQEGVWNPLVA